MMISLHKNARTTPAMRTEIAASRESARSLAQRFGVTEATPYKWKQRESIHDRSHTAQRLQTTFNAAQEAVVVERRKSLCCPWTICWRPPVSFCVLKSRVRGGIAACVATAWASCARSSLRRLPNRSNPLKATCPVICIWT